MLRATEIHADDAVRVIAVHALRCDANKSGRIYRLFARIEPAAMVVCTAGESRIIGLGSAKFTLDELILKIPGLRDLVNEK